MRVLVIDNYDSFTYNLVQLTARVSGVEPIVVLNDETSWDSLRQREFDAIILSPGPGRADRPGDFGLCGDAIADGRYPILGVCLGHQGIAHYFGGRIVHAPEPMHGRLSDVVHSGEELFEGLPSPFRAVRYHSFVVRDLPPEVRETASTRDGLVMGLRHISRPLWGVQFHPESVSTEHGDRLIANFLDLAARANASDRPRLARNSSRTAKRAKRRCSLQVFTRELGDTPSAESAFAALYGDSANAFWLDSSAVIEGRSRFSFMGDDAGPNSETLSYDVVEQRITRRCSNQNETFRETIFDYLKRRLAEIGCNSTALPFPFSGGFVGYLGYEIKADTGGQLAHKSPHPDAQLIFADRFVAFDHVDQRAWLVCLDAPANARRAEHWFDHAEIILKNAAGETADIDLGTGSDDGVFALHHGREAYLRLIAKALQNIVDGESYEVCLTNQSRGKLSLDTFAAYRALRKHNPAPYAALLRFGRLSVLCCSPERFVQIDSSGRVESKPIKGTIKRSADAEEDAQLRDQLSNSEKDRAENLMIVDLIRNDLGRTCEIGTVTVPRLCHIESYASVHQMVSTVVGQLSPRYDAVDCVRTMFPGGSMTGAPKVRTMQIIDDLEGRSRGVYSGAIGFLSLDGAVDLNIVIRTAVIEDDTVTIGAGGALVALSDPSAEFEEAMLKSQLIRDTLCRAASQQGAGATNE